MNILAVNWFAMALSWALVLGWIGLVVYVIDAWIESGKAKR